MSTETLRVAIVGLDHWYTALELADGFIKHPQVELVGIADADIARAREVAENIGLAEYTDDLQKYLHDDRVDVIASMITVDRNPEIVIAAANAGKHILSIKPFANTLEEGTAIVEAVRAAGVTFVPAETRSRQTEQNQYLKRTVDDGTLGRIVSGNFTLISSLPQNWPGAPFDGGWWTDPAKVPGGGWIDHSIYQVDRLRWLLGEEVVRVTGRTANLIHPDLEVEDYGHAIIEFAGGATFAIEDTWSGPAGSWRINSVLIGTESALAIDSINPEMTTFSPEHGWTTQPTPPDGGDAYGPLIDHFTGVGGTSLGDERDAWENLAVCLAFYESARTGGPVEVQHLP